jgi:hypothetical protein
MVERGERWTTLTTEMPAFFFLLAVLPGACVLGLALQLLRWTDHRAWLAALLLIVAAAMLFIILAVYATWYIHARISAAARPKS